MTYNTYELSTSSGEVFEDYEFFTKNKTWKFSTHDTLHNGYEPLEISRNNLERTDNLLKQDLEITIPIDCPLAAEVLAIPPEDILHVNAFSAHVLSPQVMMFKGRLVSTEVKRHTYIMLFEPISTTMRRHGFQSSYQRQCRHELYGYFCGVDKGEHNVTGTVTSVSSGQIIVDGISEFSDKTFTAGYLVAASGASRMITNHVGTTLSILRSMPELKIGDSLTIYKGCDHLFDTCKNKFDNGDSYGGFDNIPRTNPFGGKLIF